MDRDSRLAMAAAMRRHAGLITTADADEIGIDRKALSRATRSGELERVRQRVYLAPGMAPSWETEMLADLAACHTTAFAAGSAALKLHGLTVDGLPCCRELVVIGSARPTVDSNVVVHRTVKLDPIDTTVVGEVPTTTVERAFIDVSARLNVSRRLQAVDDAVMSGIADREVLHARASALWRGRKGVGTILRATEPGAEARFKSELERRGMRLLIEAGVHDAQVNVVPRHAPAAGETDVVSEADRLIIDWDGLRFHSSRRARQRDNDKANAAAIGGYVAIRFTWYDVHHRPAYVIATVRQFLHTRRSRA